MSPTTSAAQVEQVACRMPASHSTRLSLLLALCCLCSAEPAHWDPIDPAHGNTSLVLLSKDNAKHAAEIAAVEQGWTSTAGLGTIVSIHRVQNLHLHKQFEAKKAALKKAGRLSRSDDVRVYHGTQGNAPSLIHSSKVGFDPSLGRARPG